MALFAFYYMLKFYLRFPNFITRIRWFNFYVYVLNFTICNAWNKPSHPYDSAHSKVAFLLSRSCLFLKPFTMRKTCFHIQIHEIELTSGMSFINTFTFSVSLFLYAHQMDDDDDDGGDNAFSLEIECKNIPSKIC